MTALRDGAAWHELAQRVDLGDLRPLAQELDALRHEVRAKVMQPLPWSPLQEVDLASVPFTATAQAPGADTTQRPLSLFMEDTVHPHEGRLEKYVEASGSHYASEMREHDAQGRALLRIEASFRTAFGSHRRREIILWQRVIEPRGILPLLMREVPETYLEPGKWMHDALALRDQWQSRRARCPGRRWADLPPVADRRWPRTLPAVQTAPVTLEPATRSDAPLLANLLELYVHDLSEDLPGADRRRRALRLRAAACGRSRSGASRSFRAGRDVAGFSFVTRGSPATTTPRTLDVAEFFVLRGWRRSGVGRRAAPLLWDRLPGPWTVRVSTANRPGLPFWESVVRDYTGGAFEASEAARMAESVARLHVPQRAALERSA